MKKQSLWNSVITKYHDLSVSHRLSFRKQFVCSPLTNQNISFKNKVINNATLFSSVFTVAQDFSPFSNQTNIDFILYAKTKVVFIIQNCLQTLFLLYTNYLCHNKKEKAHTFVVRFISTHG